MIKGSIPALVTPFKNGELDLVTLKKLVDWHIDQGSTGLVPVGTTGESPTLSHEEHEIVVEEVVKAAAGRVPVIAGAGSNNTVEGIRLIQEREARLSVLDLALARGLDDAEKGRLKPMSDVVSRLEAKYQGMGRATE